MKKYLFGLLLFFFNWGHSYAGNVTVSGRLSGFKPYSLVRIVVNADPFSRWKVTLASTRSDEQGNYVLNFQSDHPVYAQLDVNLKKGDLFLFPDGKYQVDVVNDTTVKGSVFDSRPLNLNVTADDHERTGNMDRFNMLYNNFLENNYRNIYQYHNQRLVYDFRKNVDSLFSKSVGLFLKEYIRYSIASLEWGSRKYPVQVFARKYFAEQPVLYQNIEYAQLFDDFFRDYFIVQPASAVTIDKIADSISSRSLKKLDNLFKKDPVLSQNGRVRQLAEMVLMRKLFYQSPYLQYAILNILKEISQKGQYVENRKIAVNWINKLTYLLPGTPAPDLSLPDFDGNESSLKNWKGKFVLLAFYQTQCPLCVYQWNEIEKMQEKLGSDFVPVAIIKGNDLSEYQKLYENENGKFTYLLLGNDILLPEKYQVIGFPSYVLLNPDGTIAMAPAPMPQDNALQKFSLYMQEYKKSKQK